MEDSQGYKYGEGGQGEETLRKFPFIVHFRALSVFGGMEEEAMVALRQLGN